MYTKIRGRLGGRAGGFTLIELVVVVAILGILISLAVPRYLGVRKSAYKEEADNILQEMKTLEWAYYEQWNSFDTTGQSVGLAMPAVAHWSSPSVGGSATSVQITMSGIVAPLTTADSVWVNISSDGSASGGSSY